MSAYTVKITSKGQVTLPKVIRDVLKTNIISFELQNNEIKVKPVNNVAGSLKGFQKDISFQEAREIAWNAHINEK
jgi:bifunctional DNA-binding transcriptional regulator/antitoxin component of YhaV-PrlF toxin-antitoxin module